MSQGRNGERRAGGGSMREREREKQDLKREEVVLMSRLERKVIDLKLKQR